MSGAVTVAEVGPEAAGEVLGIVHAAFAARPALDPPATAMEETVETIAAALAAGGGLLATRDGAAVGALLLAAEAEGLALRRVAVHPDAQGLGVAQALAAAGEDLARRRGCRRTRVLARAELPGTVRFWERCGYRETGRQPPFLTLAKELPVVCAVPTADSMRELGVRLARVLRPGDLVILTGDLGAGKTTLTQGLGAGLGVRGSVTSPTFVISRIHPSLGEGPALVHVDAYRLGGLAELDDLDLDVSVEESVTVVEWGEGLAETLAEDRLELTLTRGAGEDEERTVRLVPVGARWVGSDLAAVVA